MNRRCGNGCCGDCGISTPEQSWDELAGIARISAPRTASRYGSPVPEERQPVQYVQNLGQGTRFASPRMSEPPSLPPLPPPPPEDGGWGPLLDKIKRLLEFTTIDHSPSTGDQPLPQPPPPQPSPGYDFPSGAWQQPPGAWRPPALGRPRGGAGSLAGRRFPEVRIAGDASGWEGSGPVPDSPTIQWGPCGKFLKLDPNTGECIERYASTVKGKRPPDYWPCRNNVIRRANQCNASACRDSKRHRALLICSRKYPPGPFLDLCVQQLEYGGTAWNKLNAAERVALGDFYGDCTGFRGCCTKNAPLDEDCYHDYECGLATCLGQRRDGC
jgi:hypothetical protein